MSFISKEIIENYVCYEYKELTSTNDELKTITDFSNNIVILDQSQTKGRGRRANIWSSPLGNLYFSYNQELEQKDLSKIVYITSLSLAKTIQEISPDLDIKIKWPNDIMINKSKVSGILIEHITNNQWCIGIGVNVISSPNLKNTPYHATSLKENGITLDRKEILHYYLKNYQILFSDYKTKGFDSIKTKWLSLALNLNNTITIKQENKIKTGVFKTIDDNGCLILEHDGTEEKIIVGEFI